jgi:hypothetical protein
MLSPFFVPSPLSYSKSAKFLNHNLAHIRILIGGGALLEPRQGVGVFFPAAGNFLNRSLPAHRRQPARQRISRKIESSLTLRDTSAVLENSL